MRRKFLPVSVILMCTVMAMPAIHAQMQTAPQSKPAPPAHQTSQAQADSYFDADTMAAQYGSDTGTPQEAGFSDAWYAHQNRVLLDLIGRMSQDARTTRSAELQYEQRFYGDKREIFRRRLSSVEQLINDHFPVRGH